MVVRCDAMMSEVKDTGLLIGFHSSLFKQHLNFIQSLLSLKDSYTVTLSVTFMSVPDPGQPPDQYCACATLSTERGVLLLSYFYHQRWSNGPFQKIIDKVNFLKHI